MWFFLEAIADAIMAIEWSTIADVALGAFLAVWVTHQAPHPGAGRQVVIPTDGANGCHTDMTVNGHVVRVLLDSGATGMPLVFGSNQADDLGVDGPLDYSHSYSSANGIGHEAFVRLREITLSGWTMHGVPAVITQVAQNEGLLGAEFLHRLNFTTSDGYCTLSMPLEARMTARTVRHRRQATE
jgi:clan AA aspartic protease (TIGR02281 family)